MGGNDVEIVNLPEKEFRIMISQENNGADSRNVYKDLKELSFPGSLDGKEFVCTQV